MRSLTKTNLLKEKCLAELEIMLPYHEFEDEIQSLFDLKL